MNAAHMWVQFHCVYFSVCVLSLRGTALKEQLRTIRNRLPKRKPLTFLFSNTASIENGKIHSLLNPQISLQHTYLKQPIKASKLLCDSYCRSTRRALKELSFSVRQVKCHWLWWRRVNLSTVVKTQSQGAMVTCSLIWPDPTSSSSTHPPVHLAVPPRQEGLELLQSNSQEESVYKNISLN